MRPVTVPLTLAVVVGSRADAAVPEGRAFEPVAGAWLLEPPFALSMEEVRGGAMREEEAVVGLVDWETVVASATMMS